MQQGVQDLGLPESLWALTASTLWGLRGTAQHPSPPPAFAGTCYRPFSDLPWYKIECLEGATLSSGTPEGPIVGSGTHYGEQAPADAA